MRRSLLGDTLILLGVIAVGIIAFFVATMWGR